MNNSQFVGQYIALKSGRGEIWKEEIQNNPELVKALQEGVVPLIHPNLHDFRPRLPQKEINSEPFTIIKNYVPAKQRAELANQIHQNQFLSKEPYQPKPNTLLRQREEGLEIGPAFRYGLRTENERVMKTLKENQILDYNAKDNKMLSFPEWKHPQKEKWTDPYQKSFDFSNYKVPWSEIPTFLGEREKYIDGYEVIGDVGRKRNKQLEGKRQEFEGTIKQDAWNTKLHVSQSLNTKKIHDLLNIESNFENYSQNNKLKNYKASLVTTKSIDHVVPFTYSMSGRTLEIRDLQPINRDKLYPKTNLDLIKNDKYQSKQNQVGQLAFSLDKINLKQNDELSKIKSVASVTQSQVSRVDQTFLMNNTKQSFDMTRKSFFSILKRARQKDPQAPENVKKEVSYYFDGLFQ